MPTYDYKCTACDHEFEAFHGMLVNPLVDCPACHQPKLIKLIGPGAAVIIKGTENPCTGSRGSKTKNKSPKTKKRDRLGEGKHKNDAPWWRNENKVNKKILKNPDKYIKEGKVD